jgi:hypothetical protein
LLAWKRFDDRLNCGIGEISGYIKAADTLSLSTGASAAATTAAMELADEKMTQRCAANNRKIHMHVDSVISRKEAKTIGNHARYKSETGFILSDVGPT